MLKSYVRKSTYTRYHLRVYALLSLNCNIFISNIFRFDDLQDTCIRKLQNLHICVKVSRKCRISMYVVK